MHCANVFLDFRILTNLYLKRNSNQTNGFSEKTRNQGNCCQRKDNMNEDNNSGYIKRKLTLCGKYLLSVFVTLVAIGILVFQGKICILM